MDRNGRIDMNAQKLAFCIGLSVSTSIGCTLDQTQQPPPSHEIQVAKDLIGKLAYFDTSLSTPAGQSCASCHSPDTGFAEPHSALPVSQGVLSWLVGNRNSPTAAYAAFSPPFHFDDAEAHYVGGQFWDGRASTLADQAKGPFLNPLEMHNPDKATVIASVRASSYAALFEQAFGKRSLEDVEGAYDKLAEAIAAYEATDEVVRFTSKYDFFLKGEATLSDAEARGLTVFNMKAKCASCHVTTLGPDDTPPLFTDFTYDNLGVPKNQENPFYDLPAEYNPAGWDYVDLGLGSVLNDSAQNGKMKVPTLRNVALTAPYMHNGVFKTLREVVDFYNTRDTGMWDAPEVPENINTEELGKLELTDQEASDLVEFMGTLTDGYVPPGG
jgi:cytochrome c peroxidase